MAVIWHDAIPIPAHFPPKSGRLWATRRLLICAAVCQKQADGGFVRWRGRSGVYVPGGGGGPESAFGRPPTHTQAGLPCHRRKQKAMPNSRRGRRSQIVTAPRSPTVPVPAAVHNQPTAPAVHMHATIALSLESLLTRHHCRYLLACPCGPRQILQSGRKV